MNLAPIPSFFYFSILGVLRHPQAFGFSGIGNIESRYTREGVKIFRSASSSWYENLDKEEVTQSSKDGKFSFRGITAISPGGLVHQTGVRIKIWTVIDSKEFVLFEITKSNYKKFGELTYEKPRGIAEVTKGEKRILLAANIQLDSNQTEE